MAPSMRFCSARDLILTAATLEVHNRRSVRKDTTWIFRATCQKYSKSNLLSK